MLAAVRQPVLSSADQILAVWAHPRLMGSPEKMKESFRGLELPADQAFGRWLADVTQADIADSCFSVHCTTNSRVISQASSIRVTNLLSSVIDIMTIMLYFIRPVHEQMEIST